MFRTEFILFWYIHKIFHGGWKISRDQVWKTNFSDNEERYLICDVIVVKKKRTFKSRLLDLVLSLYWLRSHVKQHLPPPALQGSTEQARSASEVWWERGQSRIKRGFLSPLLSLIINSWQISPKGDREQLGTRQPANTRFYHLFSTYWLKTSSKINWEKNNWEIRKLLLRYVISKCNFILY